MQYTISGNRLSSGLYYSNVSAINNDSPTDLGAIFESTILPLILDCQSLEVVYECLYVTGVQADFVNPYVHYLSSVVGAVAQESVPSNIAAVIQLRQGDASSRHNGRIFVSGIPETEIESSMIRGSFMTGALAALATALETPLVGSLGTYTLVTKYLDAVGPPKVWKGYTIDQVNPTRAMGTQRRRTTELRQFHP